MTAPADYPRGVVNRGNAARGTPGQGNPGTFVDTETIDGITYARYRAEEGTWVSASLRQLGYDKRYDKSSAYGAYAGVVRTPEGKPLAAPDRIRPGQEYLIPLSGGDWANRISAAPRPPDARATGAQDPPRQPAATAPAVSRERSSAVPGAGVRQKGLDDRATQNKIAPSREKKLADPDAWVDQLVMQVLNKIMSDGTVLAEAGRALQQDHLDNARGIVGLVSDWLNDVPPPYIGAWNNARNFFVLAKEQLKRHDVHGAIASVVTGRAQLRDMQRAWNDYVDASIRGGARTTEHLETIRDTAAAVEVALMTGDLAAPLVGNVGGVLVGGTVGGSFLSESNSLAGEAVRGTAEEVERAGLEANARLAREALVGIAYGLGESLSQLSELPNAARALLLKAGDILANLFKDPAKLLSDLARLPEAVALFFEALDHRWEWLKALPPERQAFEIGRLSGHIEAALVAMKASSAVGSAAADAAGDLGATLGAGGDVSVGAGGSAVLVPGRAVAVQQLVSLQLQIQEVAAASGVLTGVAMAAGPGGPPSAGSSGQPPKKPVRQEGERIAYGDKANTPGFERHEVLQNVWLQVQKVIKRRGQGFSSKNWAVLLKPETHRMVSRFQRQLGLFDRAKIGGWSYKKVLAANALALQLAGVSKPLIWEIMKEALEQAILLAPEIVRK